jgi:hypothetical protein
MLKNGCIVVDIHIREGMRTTVGIQLSFTIAM